MHAVKIPSENAEIVIPTEMQTSLTCVCCCHLFNLFSGINNSDF